MKRNIAEYLKRVLVWSGPMAAGLSGIWVNADAAPVAGTPLEARPSQTRIQPIMLAVPNRMEGPALFVGHRSHSSHRSHGSHRSHYSGSGGGYTAPSYNPPADVPSPPPPPPPPSSGPLQAPVKPSIGGSVQSGTSGDSAVPGGAVPARKAKASQQDAIAMAMRVQVELFGLGYYKGQINGKIDPTTRQALKDFQTAEGLTASGTMDNATLAKLGIAGK